MHRLLSLVLVSLIACGCASRHTRLRTDELSVSLTPDTLVDAMKVGRTRLGVTPSPLVTLCDVADGTFHSPSAVTGNLAQGLVLNFATAKATATLTARSQGGALRFACNLQGTDGPARGMLLSFAFPFDATGWHWHKDMQTSEAIREAEVYENVRPLRIWADMPEWKDKPALRMGYSNRNFCTVLTSPKPDAAAGLCLAVPIDKPCIFRTAYDARAKRLEIVYDFALSPDTRKPNAVDFAFDLYACDPAWGFRSALERYYRLYPHLFANMVKEPGQWMAFSRLSHIDNANEFYFALQEGAPEPDYDDKINVLSAPYLTHAGQFARIPNYDPETQPLPPFAEQLKAMDAAFKRRTHKDGVYRAVGLHTTEGTLDIRKTRVYGHIIAQFNLDPELPYGKWTLENAVRRTERIRTSKGATLDGFYYDGLSAGINYRPDHFKTATAPCLWDPKAKKPLLNNFFSSCEFARAAAELLRPRGQVTMMNGALGASFYVAPWLDLFGAETGLRIKREALNYIRSTSYHKPFLTLLKGNYEKNIGRPQVELFMKRCLAYGIFPGFFDWPPSGLGPGGRYWAHPRYYERDRDLHRKYQPLCRALAMAGWEPVTHARSSEPNVFVERFGPTPDGVAWLTLLNEEGDPHHTTLTIDAKALGLDARRVEAVDVVSGATVALARNHGTLTADLDVAADGVMAIQLATPAAASRWRVQQAIDTLDRGITMRKVDNNTPAKPVHWRRNDGVEVATTATPHLMLVGDGKRTVAASQWAMLFQPDPAPVTLRVRARADKVVGKKGCAAIRFRIAWVTPSFSHYEWRIFNLPTGSYGWKDFEFKIDCEHPLRAIHVAPTLTGAKGTLRVAKASLSDATQAEYVIDPEFAQWHEPVPAAIRAELDQTSNTLRTALAKLSAGDPTAEGTRPQLFDVFAQCTKIRNAIAAANAQNGCRRVVRDLDAIQEHLSFVTLAAFDLKPPAIHGPFAATPGDSVALSFAPPTLAGVPTKAELQCDTGTIARTATGASLTLPPDAEVGSTCDVIGLVHIGPPGKAATVRTTHTVTVVKPLSIKAVSQGMDSETGACRLRITVLNHRSRPVTAAVAIHSPEGWQATTLKPLQIAAAGQATTETHLRPVKGAAAGIIELTVSATAGTDAADARLTLLYIPKRANLLKNPGFEHGTKDWGISQNPSEVDATVARSGKSSIRLHNSVTGKSCVSQSVRLDQKTPCPILVRASSKGKAVDGAPGKGYSLYVDIYYTDGTPLYGTTHNFITGTTDWQLAEMYIEPTKPIRNVNVYLLLRGKKGTAWFDDVAVIEDPRRKGNVARSAKLTVDTNYSGYNPSPINDGVIRAEALHWTKESWASADTQKEHFILFDFDKPHTVTRATIYWSLDAGVPRTSREVHVQVPDGKGWKTVATARRVRPVPLTTIGLPKPVTARRFRILQPKGKGPVGRAGLMWVRELELLTPTPR